MQKEYIEREALLNSFEELMNIACEQGSPRIGKAMRTGTCAGIAFCRNEVRHVPAADVVEVVRCKDCVSSRPINMEYWVENAFYKECVWCKWFDTGMLPDEYCSHGKRKEE